jgi:hypothetical protein
MKMIITHFAELITVIGFLVTFVFTKLTEQ